MKYCYKCGAKIILVDASFCNSCGTRLAPLSNTDTVNQPNQKSFFEILSSGISRLPTSIFVTIIILILLVLPYHNYPPAFINEPIFLFFSFHRPVLLASFLFVLRKEPRNKYLLLLYLLLLAWDFSGWVLQVEIESIGKRMNDYYTPTLEITWVVLIITTIVSSIIAMIMFSMIKTRSRIVAATTGIVVSIHLLFKCIVWARKLGKESIDTSILPSSLLEDVYLFGYSFSFIIIIVAVFAYIKYLQNK